MKRLLIQLLFFFVVIIAFNSCDPPAFFKQTYPIPQQTWNADSILNFSFVVEDTLSTYSMYMDIVHHNDYPFQNLYVKLHSYFPDGLVVSEQHSLELQEKNGVWMGDCGKDFCELRFILREQMIFNQLGEHRLSVEQYTRRSDLQGLKSIGLWIDKKK